MFSPQHHLMVIGFYTSQVLPFDASSLANFQPPGSLAICLNTFPVLLEYVLQPLTKQRWQARIYVPLVLLPR